MTCAARHQPVGSRDATRRAPKASPHRRHLRDRDRRAGTPERPTRKPCPRPRHDTSADRARRVSRPKATCRTQCAADQPTRPRKGRREGQDLPGGRGARATRARDTPSGHLRNVPTSGPDAKDDRRPGPGGLGRVRATAATAATAASAASHLVTEDLTNAVTHVRADRLRVTLDAVGAHLRIEATDDGIGGARPNPSGGARTGLRRLADPADALSGRLAVDRPPSTGTALQGRPEPGRSEDREVRYRKNFRGLSPGRAGRTGASTVATIHHRRSRGAAPSL